MTPDIGEINLIPKLYARLAKEAPGITLKAVSMPAHATSEAIESGLADLALGYYPDLPRSCSWRAGIVRAYQTKRAAA